MNKRCPCLRNVLTEAAVAENCKTVDGERFHRERRAVSVFGAWINYILSARIDFVIAKSFCKTFSARRKRVDNLLGYCKTRCSGFTCVEQKSVA
jgi:hypothetical protein